MDYETIGSLMVYGPIFAVAIIATLYYMVKLWKDMKWEFIILLFVAIWFGVGVFLLAYK